MCIISVIPQDHELPDIEKLKACWARNDDGGGLMVVNPANELEVHKEMDEDLFLQLVQEKHKEFGEQSPMVLHFRVGTHGGVQIKNNHPFWVQENVAMAHNGVLSSYGDRGWGRSDTREFAEDVLRNLQPDFHMNIAIRELLVEVLGGDPMVFLDNQRRAVILNRGRGTMDGPVWYSNTGFTPIEKRKFLPAKQEGRAGAFHVICRWCYEPVNSFWNQQQYKHMLPHWVDEKYPLCRLCSDGQEMEEKREGEKKKKAGAADFVCYSCDDLFAESSCSFGQYNINAKIEWVCDDCTEAAHENNISIQELKAYLVSLGGNK